MEKYLAVVNRSGSKLCVIEISSETLTCTNKYIVDKSEVGLLIQKVGGRPLNFGVENNVFKESAGNLDRLFFKDGIQPHIVIQEMSTKAGRIVGYRLLNPCNLNIVPMQKEVILKKQETTSVPLLQNGIIRGNAVSCFPNQPFPKFIIGTATKTAVKKPKLVSEEHLATPEKKEDILSKFTPEQRRELSKARSNNIDIRFMLNPELSTEQMRVLWVSKKKGVYSEYFAKPEYSVEVMKFYADRLLTQRVVKECSDLLARPRLSVTQLTELYLAICEGVDYSSFIDFSNAKDMYVKRLELRDKLWTPKESKASVFDAEFINSGVKLAEKLKNKR